MTITFYLQDNATGERLRIGGTVDGLPICLMSPYNVEAWLGKEAGKLKRKCSIVAIEGKRWKPDDVVSVAHPLIIETMKEPLCGETLMKDSLNQLQKIADKANEKA